MGDDHKENLIDRLSELPDSLILEILSNLPIKDAAQTSCLSGRWRHLWASILDLDFRMNQEPMELLPSFINSLLLHRNGSKIRKFKLYAFDIFDEHVNSWVDIVVRCNVEELYLNFFRYTDGDVVDDERHFPFQSIFSCQSLVQLKLEFCELDLPPDVCLPKLKSLCLKDIELADDCLKNILHGCPIIESLKIKECNQLSNLKVNVVNSHLKNLTIEDYFESPVDEMDVEISAPQLLSLKITKTLARKSYRILNVSSLVSASFLIDSFGFVEDEGNKLLDLLQQTRHVQVLELSNGCFESLLEIDTPLASHPISFGIKTLVLQIMFCKCELQVLAYLLKNSDIENLVLDVVLNPRSRLFSYQNYLGTWNYEIGSAFPCFPKHLKTVKIRDFGVTYAATHIMEIPGRVDEMAFARFLLGKSTMLEKLTITFQKSFKYRSSLTSWLLLLPKASPSVQVIIHG